MTVADLAAQVVEAVMPVWRSHLAVGLCVCGWDEGSPDPYVNQCDQFGDVVEETLDEAVPYGPDATRAFLEANPDLWTAPGGDFAGESLSEALASVVRADIYDLVAEALEEAAGPLVPPDAVPCEGKHNVAPPAVAFFHLTESQSTANIAFVCRPCLVQTVKDWLDDTPWEPFEIRPIAPAPQETPA